MTSEDLQPRVLYADSTVAIREAWRRGVPRDTPIRTSSPALLREADLPCDPIDGAVTPEVMHRLEEASLAIADEVYHLAMPDRNLAISVARAAFSSFQVLLLRAATMREVDFTDPIVVTRIVQKGSNEGNRYRGFVADILADNPNLTVVDLAAESVDGLIETAPPTPTLVTRLRYAQLGTLFFRGYASFCARTGFPGLRGTILVLRENELVKEAAVSLVRRGFALRNLRSPKLDIVPSGETSALGDGAVAIARRHLDGLMPSKAADAAAAQFGGLVRKAAEKYEASVAAWRVELDRLRRTRPRAILTNFLADPVSVGLYQAARERGISMVTVQHGVTMEIHERARRYHAIHENCATDLSLVFNRRGALALERNPYGVGETAVVGLPAEYSRAARVRSRRTFPPVWYISTSLYLGNQGLLSTGVTDDDKAAFEVDVVEKLLAHLPHEVLYKPYPGVRYLDEDPVTLSARKAPNVEVFDERIDLRYIVAAARILVTSRSYSTPSWCIMTGKPLVLIDIPNQAQFTEEAREAFREGVFLFDAGAPGFFEELREFLSLPIEEIEDRYRKMAPARDRLIDEYVGDQGGRAGPRAARAILSCMRRQQSDPAA